MSPYNFASLLKQTDLEIHVHFGMVVYIVAQVIMQMEEVHFFTSFKNKLRFQVTLENVLRGYSIPGTYRVQHIACKLRTRLPTCTLLHCPGDIEQFCLLDPHHPKTR